MTRPVPEAALAIILKYEGCRLQSYRNHGDLWTVGYGHTRQAYPGQVISPATAEALLATDAQAAGAAVLTQIRVALNDNRYGALVSFVFEEGVGRLAHSHALLPAINAGRFQDVPAALASFNLAGSRPNPWLKQRRAEEAALWNTPVEGGG